MAVQRLVFTFASVSSDVNNPSDRLFDTESTKMEFY